MRASAWSRRCSDIEQTVIMTKMERAARKGYRDGAAGAEDQGLGHFAKAIHKVDGH